MSASAASRSLRTASVTLSLLAQNEIYHPTTSYMLSRLPAVIQDVGVSATGFFKGIGQDRHTVKGSFIVDALGYLLRRAVIPGDPSGVDGNRAKGKRAKNIP